MTVNEHRQDFFWGDENILKLGSGVSFITL